MRLTYKNNKKSKDIREKTLAQMRKLKTRFEEEHPELLSRIRAEVGKQALYNEEVPSPPPKSCKEHGEDELKIDKKKNLETILSLTEIHSGSSEFQTKLKAILLDTVKR